MSPENARVFIVEDNKDFLDIIEEYLKEAGDSIVLSRWFMDATSLMYSSLLTMLGSLLSIIFASIISNRL